MPKLNIPAASFPQNVTLCSNADVYSLLGQIGINFSFDDTLTSTAVAQAQETLQSRCRRPLVPTRIVRPVDGNGGSRFVMPDAPILAINMVSIYYNFPLVVSRVAHEFDFNIDRRKGVIAFPPFPTSAAVQPYAFVFWKASMNVVLDYVVGWTKNVYAETLTTTDRLTYTFANLTVIAQAIGTTPNQSAPPLFGPQVYVDGVAQINTSYTATGDINANWTINQDSLIYTVNYNTNGGIKSITFPQSMNGHTITADYAYQYTPQDLREACTKQAAITILSSIATAPYADITMGGMTSIQADGFRTQANDRGQWGPQIAQWEAEIASIVKTYTKMSIPTFSFSNHGGW